MIRTTYVTYTGIRSFDMALAKLSEKWHGAVAAAIAGALLLLVTWGIASVSSFLQGRRPPLVYFLIPIAFTAATLGRKAGLAVTVLASILAGIFLITDSKVSGYHFAGIDVLALGGTLTAALMVVALIGRLRESLDEVSAAHAREIEIDAKLLESEERRITFNKEVLLAVTGGRLLLCDDAEIARSLRGTRLLHQNLREPRDVTLMRTTARNILVEKGRLQSRLYDFEATSTEAATNAIKHGSGGYYELWDDGENALSLIVDTGGGIEPKDLARATLERGFSTHVSLGIGFKMMWELADQIAVSTCENGTTILINIVENPRSDIEAGLLDRYPILDV